MNEKIKICYSMLDFKSDTSVTPSMLRGFLAHLFAHITEFHHHSDNAYHYPLIQYKRIDGKLSVVGIKEFADVVLKNTSNLGHITTKTDKIPLNNVAIKSRSYQLKQIPGKYIFVSPWLALNNENYAKFKNMKKADKKPFLENILVGNILSMLKGLEIFVDYEIATIITKFKSVQVSTHNNRFVGIYAEFVSNTLLPDCLGLGKSVTKGMGTVKSIP